MIQIFTLNAIYLIFLQKGWQKPSNTPQSNYHIRSFKVTHPFHPLLGKKYDLVTYRHNWGENRVYFHDKNRGLINYIRISQLMKYS